MSLLPQSPAVLVLERDPYWSPELQRRFRDEAVVVRSCRRLGDLDALLTECDAAVVVLVLSADPAGCLAWLARRATEVPVVVLGSPESVGLEPMFRSVGATSFQAEVIAGGDLARLCRGLLRA